MRDVYLQTQNGGKPLISENACCWNTQGRNPIGLGSFGSVGLQFPLSLTGVAFFMREKWQVMPAVYRIFALFSMPLLFLGL